MTFCSSSLVISFRDSAQLRMISEQEAVGHHSSGSLSKRGKQLVSFQPHSVLYTLNYWCVSVSVGRIPANVFIFSTARGTTNLGSLQ